ncbi:MAG TPA: SRPBCC domain-containing protein [Pyrinomonadaceae bacterium]|nr:SRPBCC domain-containing protein [Pyrinomonadaceae bacterium]
MPDVLHQFVINATPEVVWKYFATGEGLAKWWTESSKGAAAVGEVWQLYFMPGYDWRARVTRCEPNAAIEFTILEAMEDWIGTRVGVELRGSEGKTVVDFYHRGWPDNSDHFRISSFCWATYLRLLKRHIEHGEFTPYGQRDDA